MSKHLTMTPQDTAHIAKVRAAQAAGHRALLPDLAEWSRAHGLLATLWSLHFNQGAFEYVVRGEHNGQGWCLRGWPHNWKLDSEIPYEILTAALAGVGSAASQHS